VRHALGERTRVRVQPIAVQKVLKRVVGGVADVGLRINHEPWLALRFEHVAGVQIRAEEDLAIG
jgi:hypothetical protein